MIGYDTIHGDKNRVDKVGNINFLEKTPKHVPHMGAPDLR